MQFADGLQRLEAGIGQELTGLIQASAIAAIRTRGIVLILIDARTGLHKKVRVVEEVERLSLQRDDMAFGEMEGSADSQVYLLNRGSVKLVESLTRSRRRPQDSRRRIARGLVRCAVVHRVSAGAGCEQAGVGTPGIELHDGAERPIRQQRSSKLTVQLRGAWRIDRCNRQAMALVEQRRAMRITEIKLIVKVHAVHLDIFREGVGTLK